MSVRTLKIAAAATLIAVVAVALYLRLKAGVVNSGGDRAGNQRTRESPLEKGRTALRQSHSLGTIRDALQQFNTHLVNEGKRPPAPSQAERERLREQFQLTPEEMAEVEQASFTLLDGHHLDLCFLLNDAAQSLDIRPRRGEPLPPEREAEAAFAWVMRQVQVPGNLETLTDPAASAAAPEFALRRGFGTPLTRALIFLRLLEQLGHDGCLIASPAGPDQPPRYWACGVLGTGGRVYLFDPRMGIPLPGPDGKGIATLAEVRKKDSAALAQLRFDQGDGYDVTLEEVAAAELHLAPSLSALAPRMKLLEEKLLAPTSRIKLAADLEGTRKRFAEALAAAGGDGKAVRVSRWAAKVQRNFYPVKEGGGDRSEAPAARKSASLAGLAAPFYGYFLNAVPPALRDPTRWRERPLDRVFNAFVGRFIDFYLKPGQPRDLALRGHFVEAASAIGPLLDELERLHGDYLTNYDPEMISKWFKADQRAFAAGDPGRQEQVWRTYREAVMRLVDGASAEPRQAQARHLRALCKQEQAERLWFGLTNAGPTAPKRNLQEVENAWIEARHLWQSYLEKHKREPTAPAARMGLARAQQVLSEIAALKVQRAPPEEREALQAKLDAMRRAAIRSWRDAAGEEIGPLQRLACRYRAWRLEQQASRGR